jgi:hypothetical protein
MKKSLLLALSLFSLSALAFAGPQAVLSGLKGKVEVKLAQGSWAPATEGMKVDLRSTISTGFDSTAVIVIDKSKIVVKPLTRLTLDKLVEQSAGSVAASMFLRVGAVQASVKATTPGTPQDFKVQSPYSTASVRGTEFDFDGFHLAVKEGVVRLIPGRPVRDIQAVEGSGNAEGAAAEGGEGTSAAASGSGESGSGAEATTSSDTGFEGTIAVAAASSDAGVNVAKDQKATVSIQGGSSGASSASSSSSTKTTATQSSTQSSSNQAGGVTIKIVVKD